MQINITLKNYIKNVENYIQQYKLIGFFVYSYLNLDFWKFMNEETTRIGLDKGTGDEFLLLLPHSIDTPQQLNATLRVVESNPCEPEIMENFNLKISDLPYLILMSHEDGGAVSFLPIRLPPRQEELKNFIFEKLLPRIVDVVKKNVDNEPEDIFKAINDDIRIKSCVVLARVICIYNILR